MFNGRRHHVLQQKGRKVCLTLNLFLEGVQLNEKKGFLCTITETCYNALQ